jgi:hypothetical protein
MAMLDACFDQPGNERCFRHIRHGVGVPRKNTLSVEQAQVPTFFHKLAASHAVHRTLTASFSTVQATDRRLEVAEPAEVYENICVHHMVVLTVSCFAQHPATTCTVCYSHMYRNPTNYFDVVIFVRPTPFTAIFLIFVSWLGPRRVNFLTVRHHGLIKFRQLHSFCWCCCILLHKRFNMLQEYSIDLPGFNAV